MTFYTVKFLVRLIVFIMIIGLQACKKEEPESRQTIQGKVTDNIGGQPLQGVKITLEKSTPVYSDAKGDFTIPNVLLSEGTSTTAVKDGYETYVGPITISANPNSNTVSIQMTPKGSIYFDPVQPLKIDANDKSKSLTLKNIGSQGPIQITIKPDPTAQWLSVTPKGPITIEQNKTAQLVISVDNKGITTLRDFSAKIQFEYSAVNTSYKSTADYEVIMSVTSLPVAAIPAVLNVVPLSGGYGTDVTISGQNFETDTSKIQVLFEGNKKALISSATPTELKVKVPVSAKTGTIRIVTGQGQGTSNAIFTYTLTCTVNTIASLSTGLYINDITTAVDGTIFVCGVEGSQSSNQILRSGVYRINPGSTREITLLEREPGFVNGALNSTAKLVNPTKLVAVNNDLYIADQYDASRYQANYAEGYASIRHMTSTELSTTPKPYYVKLTDKGFIGDILYVPQPGLNGIAFTDGSYKKYGFDGVVTEFTNYQGLNLYLDFDGTDVYSLDVEPENNPTRWILRKRSATNLLDNGTIASENLGIPNPNSAPDKTNYPKGMVVDAVNQCAYIFDRRLAGTSVAHIIYRVGLDDKKVDIIYNGFQAVSQFDNGKLLPDASGATFASVSCLTYDNKRQAILIVDVWRGNQVRSIECK
ncbi:carboxypeptidase regulatory-like domain-containing protein [Spirosoma litoris]